MGNSYAPPVISTCLDDSGEFILLATSHGRTAIAGERILRAEPWPSIRWRTDTQEEAEQEATKLRAYLDECASGKRKDVVTIARARGWWED